MNMRVIEVRVRRDGKRYPATWKLPDAEWERVVRLAHTLRCRDGLSYREVQRSLLAYGIRRSLGQVYADANRPTCPRCADQVPDAPPQPQERPAAAVHRSTAAGFLTGMIDRG
jgi:hypothetical protein